MNVIRVTPYLLFSCVRSNAHSIKAFLCWFGKLAHPRLPALLQVWPGQALATGESQA